MDTLTSLEVCRRVVESAGPGLPRSVAGPQCMSPQNVRPSELATRSAA